MQRTHDLLPKNGDDRFSGAVRIEKAGKRIVDSTKSGEIEVDGKAREVLTRSQDWWRRRTWHLLRCLLYREQC